MNNLRKSSGEFKKAYSKKIIIKYLKGVFNILRRSPTYRDLKKIPGPSPTAIISYFGSWSKALKEAGIRPKTHQLIKGEKSIIRKEWRKLTDKQLAELLKIPFSVIRYYRLSHKLWKNTRNKKLTKGTQKKIAMKTYGNKCEICNVPIIHLHHIITRSKDSKNWAILCPTCHDVITKKLVKISSREDLFKKLKPYMKKIYSENKYYN
ncbi:MAG: hypothetical protein PHN37_01380 [Candidatus Pacebacteria bacterium]|nr:hypothetical protein [Candidatus Paceibacterota bacterium]